MRISAAGSLLAALFLAAPALAQTIDAEPDNGTADAGVGSRPIANVVANDSVSGGAALLGPSGNATIAKAGTWPSGIGLNVSTGAVTTSTALPVGQYAVQYQLCDLSAPPNCAATNVTVNVIAASILPNPDSGTADAGVASRPIANVAANDTVNGAAVTLGSSGNATVAKVGTWPAGIGLTPSTGAINTTVGLAAGQYSIQYQLCDRNSPAVCATTTDSVNVITASVIANPESGSADAGTASRPIVNVAANDTVNGAPVALGASGNASVAQVGTWPTGIALTPSTGQISTTITVPAGQYSVQYQVCDKNVPPLCAAATDTVTVVQPVIVANSDSGSATAGIAAKPINNVAANDTVNGVPATLGATGNSTIAQVGTWPGGIALTPATGAITTTTAAMPGNYPLQYQLCDLNSPPVCAAGTATVTVTAAIVAAADAGWSVTGRTVTVIPNVTTNDSVNNAAVTLGASANATISQVGTWPLGLSLDPNVGAVSVTTLLQPATYQVQYQLCDLNSIPDCSIATATVYITPVYNEAQATATPMGDVEFDWGRDGLYCATCNFGDGNARASWTDRQGNIWIAHLDPNTGQFISPAVNDEQADPGNARAFFWNTYGNGPEWSFSTQNGQAVSQLVYSRYTTNDPNPPYQPAPGYTGAAMATQTGYNTWVTGFIPGAINNGDGNPGTNNSNLPEGSQCNSDPVALAMYKNFASPFRLFTEPVSTAAGTAPTLAPFRSNGIGERFVPCTHQVLFQADAAFGQFTFQQVFWYDIDTGLVEQLTTDPTSKYSGFMFRAPDFGGNYIFVTVSNHTTIQVYQQTGANPDGSPAFTLVNQITSPDSNQPYLNSAEPFIMCTPTCTTYVFSTIAKTNAQNTITDPNGLAVIALNPNTPMFNILVAAYQWPLRQRLDPEYFITPNGAYLYYNQIVPQTGSSNYKNLGEWFIDMQLGAPAGPCVGSSAEGGLMPGC
jgi:hypothetical protein